MINDIYVPLEVIKLDKGKELEEKLYFLYKDEEKNA